MHRSNFWDKMGEVDWVKDKVYIILRIAQFGTQQDFRELQKRYSAREIKEVIQEHYHNLDDLTRNFCNIKYKLHLPLKNTLNEITSGYSLRFKEKIFVG